MNRSDVDPLVGCPIVCGEYMRANGFFFAIENEIYLITARHNVLPTDGEVLRTGGISSTIKTENFHPIIDVYLRASDGFDVERIDIREVDGVKHSTEIDILGIPFDPDPEKYGYHVWESDEVVAPSESTETLDIIGFDGTAFPSSDRDYDTEVYRNEIQRPAMLGLVNEMLEADDPSKFGLMATAVDEKFVGADEEYNGLSGSPVLADGLVGIHSQNWKPPSEAINKLDEDDFMFLIYSRAEVLLKMLR